MKKNQVYIIIIILAVGVAGWFGYKYLFGKKSPGSSRTEATVQSFSPNSCWIYHEYVYRVDFSDQSIKPVLFIRETDGTFSPSIADSSGNQITGNGFIIDSTGACVTTDKIAAPWELTDEEQQPLRDIVDSWLDMKEEITNREYHITGQTVALLVILNDPKDFIEYAVSSAVPGQQGYSIIYPLEKIQLNGINTVISFPADNSVIGESVLQVLKTTFDENSTENPTVKTSIDSIDAIRNSDGYLDNIRVRKGDEFFNEGSIVFDASDKCLGNLHYDGNRWKLVSFLSFVQNPPVYQVNDPQQDWEYDLSKQSWTKK